MIALRTDKSYRRNKDGTLRGPYFHAYRNIKGLGIREYLRKTGSPINQWHVQECHYRAWLYQSSKKRKRWLKSLKKLRSSKGPRGQKTYYPKPLINILKSLGYSVKGSEIRINRKRFLKYDAICLRFAMLDDRNKEVIGSPKNLLQVTKDAFSKLKSANSRKQKTTFEKCFKHELSRFMEDQTC